MNELLLYGFLLSSSFGLAGLWLDLYMNNSGVPRLMRLVWTLTVAYSGLFGLGLYWYSGRKQISTDSLYRRAVRSTAHCYSGCGLGEIVGVSLAVIYFNGATMWLIIGSFSFAYLFGFALTVGPLMEDGVQFMTAVKDAIYTETGSITIMEIAAVGMDIFIIGGRPMSLVNPVFWIALFISLSFGFIVAYPVNAELIRHGVKSGMMNPQQY